MELSLHGSQINLATRYKPTPPTVRYPVFVQRPCSANVVSSVKQPNKLNTIVHRRPVSADSKFLKCCRNNRECNSIGNEDGNSCCCCLNEKFNREKSNLKKSNSSVTSTNIFKLLLSEPIKRSWVSADTVLPVVNGADQKHEVKSGTMQRRNAGSDGVTDGSSIEDEIPEVFSSDEDYDKDWCKTIKPSNLLKPSIATKPPVRSISLGGSAKSRFGQNKPNAAAVVVVQTSKSAAVGSVMSVGNSDSKKPTEPSVLTRSPTLHSSNSVKSFLNPPMAHSENATTSPAAETMTAIVSKTDLPGRVSFSKNDVYEIDYSDLENDTDTSRSLEHTEIYRKKNVRFEDEFFNKLYSSTVDGSAKSTGQAEQATAPKLEEIQTEEPNLLNGIAAVDKMNTAPIEKAGQPALVEKYCCSLKCNSLCKSDNNFMGSETNSIDHSERIIEEYKRQIDNINRRHELELKWSGNAMRDTPDSQSDYFNAEKPQTGGEAIRSANDTRNQQHFVEIEKRNINKPSWNNNSGGSQTATIKRQSISSTKTESDDSVTRGSSSTVIDNYLKVTNQKAQHKLSGASLASAKGRAVAKKSLPAASTGARKIRSAQPIGAPSTVNRLLKAKSANSLQIAESKLNEFHMDKVESWMSTHEDTFSDTGLARYRRVKLGSTGNLSYKKAWRETPTSKTDDEGNFSLDDQIDNNSFDESTFGDIANESRPMKSLEGTDSCEKPSASQHRDESLMMSTAAQDHTKDASEAKHLKDSASDKPKDKVKQILQYLDEVDYNCEKTINNIQLQKIPDSFRSDIEYNIEPDIVGDMPKMADLLTMPNQQLARRIISLSLRSNELSNAIQLFKEHLDKIRGEKARAIRLEQHSAQTRLKEQKSHYEGIVTRHQGFIEQLLKDKASLCEKVSALTRRIESQAQTSEHKLQTEIARVKDAAMAGEKIRRERWVRENTKKIKELTVKGLEQEINRMTNDHQKEINELKRQHQQEILNAVEESRQKHEAIEMGIRDTYAQDREAAIEKERNAIRERFERQMEIEQRAFEEQKSRLAANFSSEKTRIHNELRQKEQEFDKRREKLLQDKKDIVELLNREFADKTRMMEKRNQSELASIREQYESDFAIWKREQETMYKLREVEMANSIRQQCRMERDKQIDSIVAKVDAEALRTQQDHEVKLSRLKAQYDNELREMEHMQATNRDKCADMRTKLAESDGTIQNLQATVKQLELQLEHSKKICDELTKEKENFKDNARKEIQQDIELLRKERDAEIQQIHKRVQHAIGKKDNSVEALQKENTTLRDRCLKLETIIRQQRKDYCTK